MSTNASQQKNELRNRKSKNNVTSRSTSSDVNLTSTQEDAPPMDETEEIEEPPSSFQITPLIQSSPLLRMDVGPFALLYLSLVAADHLCSDDTLEHDTETLPFSMETTRLLITCAFATTLVVHAGVVLLAQWRVSWKVAVGYRVAHLEETTDLVEMSKWTHAHVQSLHSNSSSGSSSENQMAGIAPVQVMEHQNCAVVDFHHHIFRFCPRKHRPDGDISLWRSKEQSGMQQSSATQQSPSFRSVLYPTNLPLVFYRGWKGHGSNINVMTAQQVYGLNQTILELPSFGELLGEQLMAPFFLFQVFCVVLWSLDEYWYYALFTLCALLMFESTLAFNRQQSLQRLHHRASGGAGSQDRFWVLRPMMSGLSLRNGGDEGKSSFVWMRLPKTELLPGDVVSVAVTSTEGTTVPADLVMLQGSAVCDEALLTGESVPQLKQALDTTSASGTGVKSQPRLDLQDPLHKESVLFGGTQLLVSNNENSDVDPSQIGANQQFPQPPDGGAVGMILRTSFETVQGNLLRTMAHSARSGSNNNIHTWDTFVFIVMLIGCAIMAAALVLREGWHDERRNRFRLVLHVIIIITSVVPPELPMELSLAVTNSVAALVRTCQVYCSELFRIPWAGEVNVCCFDKTGTLTSDEMRLRGVRLPTVGGSAELAEENALLMPDEDEIPRETLRVMIGCHSLTPTAAPSSRRDNSNGGIAIVGDPLEQAVLRTSGYRLVGSNLVAPMDDEDGGSGGPAMTILHRFAFSSKLKRMTVLATEQGGKGEMLALTKGAPETLKTKLTKESTPPNYDEIAFHHMSHGRRVLAMAVRSMGTVASLQTCKDKGRDHVETTLKFVGFLVLDCPLKPDSKAIISELNQTGHETVMITGDAILTAVEVARQVAILPPSSSSETVYRIQPKELQDASEIVGFECVDVSGRYASLSFSEKEIPKLTALREQGRARFSIDGDSLIRLAKSLSASSLSQGQQPINLNNEDEKSLLLHPTALSFFSQLVPLISVFARHAPHQKEAVVAALNHGGYRTLMVGDGTNDVGALKRAHVGISIISAPEVEAKQRNASDALSQMKKKNKKRAKAGKKVKQQRQLFEQTLQQLREAQEELDQVDLGDASVAAPFTSRAVSIKCVKDVIQQGRCTLVTMLQIYKILGINCLVNAMVLSNLFLHGVKQGDQQLTILGMVVAALFFFVTRAEPLPDLSKTRPPSSVLCAQALISIALQFGVHLISIALATEAALVFVDPYDPSLVPDGPFNPNVLNSCTFMLTCVSTINTFAVNYRGPPFMQELHQNKLMYRSLQVCYAVLAICALEVFPPLNDLMQLTTLPNVEERIVEPDGPLSAVLIHIAEVIGFPFFIFWLMVVDTVLAFVAERFTRRYL